MQENVDLLFFSHQKDVAKNIDGRNQAGSFEEENWNFFLGSSAFLAVILKLSKIYVKNLT